MDSKQDIKNKRWLSHWSQMRKRGFMRYWMLYGALYFILCFLIILTTLNLFRETLPFIERFLSEKVVINLVIALGIGMILSIGQWVVNEVRYRRLGSRYPNAVRLF